MYQRNCGKRPFKLNVVPYFKEHTGIKETANGTFERFIDAESLENKLGEAVLKALLSSVRTRNDFNHVRDLAFTLLDAQSKLFDSAIVYIEKASNNGRRIRSKPYKQK